MPEIDEGTSALKEILVQPDTAISPYITFDSASRTMNFRQDESTKALTNQFLPIYITLINDKGETSEYTMHVIVFSAGVDTALEETKSSDIAAKSEVDDDTQPKIPFITDEKAQE